MPIAAVLLLLVGCSQPGPQPPINPDWLSDGAAAGGLPASVAEAPTPTPLPATATSVPVPTAMTPPPAELSLPPGYHASVFAEGLGPIRMLEVAPNGDVFASQPAQNRILVLPDRDADGSADRLSVFADGLNQPHGLGFHGNWLYVANTDSVVRFPYLPGEVRARTGPELVVPNLPGGGQNWDHTLAWGPDEHLYVSVGSSCDACVEDNQLRASILRFRSDGSEGALWARGLRNADGLAFHPETGDLWATDVGRATLGPDLPPDELNRVTPGADFGWPFCFGDRVPDPDIAPGADPAVCGHTEPPVVPITAHSEALGLTFYDGAMFPAEVHGDLFVAYHGALHDVFPTGYKLVRIPFEAGWPSGPPIDFVTGWLMPDTRRWGRPVDVGVAPDGALLVTDDGGGRIYRIFYSVPRPTPTPFR